MRADGIPIGSPVDVGKIPQREYDLRSWTDLNSGPGYRRIPADQVSGERKPFSLGRRAHQRCTDAAERYRWRFLLVTRSALKTIFLKTGAWDGAKDAIYMCARETFNTGSEGGSRAIERRSEEIGWIG